MTQSEHLWAIGSDDMERAEQVRDEETLGAVAAPPPREEFAGELSGRLRETVAGLPPASRAVVVLYYLHEMSLEETAAVLGVPLGTVKTRTASGLDLFIFRLKPPRDLVDCWRDSESECLGSQQLLKSFAIAPSIPPQ